VCHVTFHVDAMRPLQRALPRVPAGLRRRGRIVNTL
jgi:hypothetical protein